jgi:hypothetical protein
MAKKDIKKLSPAVIKEKREELDAVQEFVVNIGGDDYTLTHDIVFRKSKQHKVLDDMIDFFTEVANRDMGYLELASPYTTLLIIKHFTSLEVPEDVTEALDLLVALVDLEALTKIINALPVEEVVKVYELVTETLENFKQNLDDMEEEAKKLALENADVLGNEEDGESDTAEQTEQE